jgi:hypothetical protein
MLDSMMRMRALPWVAFACLAACSEPDVELADEDVTTDGECGELQCSDELLVSLVALAGVFDGGEYTVAAKIDGVTESCGFSLGGEASECSGDAPCVLENDCNAEFGFSVAPHFVLLRVRPAADLVQLGIARDTSTLVDITLAPEYDDYWPNGSDCEPVCKTASASVDVP